MCLPLLDQAAPANSAPSKLQWCFDKYGVEMVREVLSKSAKLRGAEAAA